jgi:hypothetical protein
MSTTITTNENNSLTLKKDAKGNYAWEIKVYGSENEVILAKVKQINDKLKETYNDLDRA